MNTILHQKRNVNFFIAAGLTLALVIVAVFAIAPSATKTTNMVPNISKNITENKNIVAFAPLSAHAFPQYRQSEWHAVAVPVTGVSGVESYPQSERTLIPAQAGLLAYYLSERTLVNPFAEYLASERTLSPIVNADFSQYQLSERTMTGSVAINDLSQYFASERALVDTLPGWAIYLESERTSVPVQFTPYQISQWFGK